MGCSTSRALPVSSVPKAHSVPRGSSLPSSSDGGDPSRLGTTADDNDIELVGASSGKAADTLVASALRVKRSRGAVILGDGHITAEDRESAARKRVPKPPQVRDMLLQALLSNVLFGAYGAAELHAMVDALELCDATPGSVVIKQGDAGDAFYVIESGKVSIPPVTSVVFCV